MAVNIKGVIKGSIFSILVTMLIIFVLSLLSYFTGISESVINACVYAAVVVGVLLGAVAVSRAAAGKAFVHVMLVCLIYIAVLVGISALINKGIAFNSHFFAVVGGAFASSFLGLIIGK